MADAALGGARHSLPALNNAAPPSRAGDFYGDADARIDAWLVRNQPRPDDPIHYGFTSWVGNAAHDDEALAHYAIARLAGCGPNCEENWGHLWHDRRYEHALTSIYHHVLALALGASGVNVYNACATSCWGPDIDLDIGHLRASMDDPHLFDSPYCPRAPIAADGRPAHKYRGARRVLSEYTVAQQIARTLSACIPSVREVQDELTERLSAAIEEPLPDGRLQAGPAAR